LPKKTEAACTATLTLVLKGSFVPELSPPLSIELYSESAKALLSLREEVLSCWSGKVKENIKQASRLTEPILINTLPAFFDHVAMAISHVSETLTDANTTNTFAQEHGGERARLSFYDYDQLIQEYYILRQCLFDIARDRGVKFTNEERIIIHQTIDVAIKESAMGFALVQANIREQFMATLAHDLRNPLGAIKMAAQIAHEMLKPEDELGALLNIIVQNADRADTMIQDLLDASLVSAGSKLNLKIAECDMLEIAHQTLEPLTVVHGSRLHLHGTSAVGWCDRAALRRALENLVLNAIKYGKSDAPITMKFEVAFGRAIYTVHNVGNPIPAEEQESIFQVFRRSQAEKSQRKQGWGLGLALVRGVAESHGGSINVESSAATGTSFVFDIPLDARPYQEAPILK
jgi:signal transduction histidine kinase